MIERLRTPTLAIAAVGFVASVVVHVLAWERIVPPASQTVMHVLQAGLLVAWFPAAVLAWRNIAGWKTDRYLRDFQVLPLVRAIPFEFRAGTCALAAYAIIVMFFPVRDALVALADMLREASAHWMFGYGAAVALLWSPKE